MDLYMCKGGLLLQRVNILSLSKGFSIKHTIVQQNEV